MATIDLSKLPDQANANGNSQKLPVPEIRGAGSNALGAFASSATVAAGKAIGYGTAALLRGGEFIAEKTGLSGDLPTTYTRASQMVKDATDRLTSNFLKGAEPYAQGHDIAKTTGQVTGQIAGQVPFLAAGQEALAPLGLGGGSASKLANATGFVAKSLGRTTISKETTTGELPSKGELGTWLAVDTVLLGLSTMAKKFYESAFTSSSGIPKKQLENYVKEFGQTPGEMAKQNYGYMGTASGIKDDAYKAGKEAWNQLTELGKTGKAVPQEDVQNMVAKVIAPMMKDLNPTSLQAMELADNAMKMVAYFSPADGAALTQENIRAILKNINSDLFGEGSKLVINPATADKLVLALKQGFKDFLPKGSRELYTTFAQNNMIWNVMNSENVKRIVGRSIIGATGGATTGFATGKLGGKGYVDSIIQGLAGGLAGVALANALDSTWVKTVFGNIGSAAFNPATTGQVIKNIVNTPSANRLSTPSK